MGWKERATPIKSPSGSWRDRATAIEPEAPGAGESLARGGAQGLSLGYSDELTGLIESLLTDKTYPESRDESRTSNRMAEEANPKTYMTGQVGGALLPVVASAVGSGGAATPAVGAGFARMMAPTTLKGMMALGGAQGLGLSEKSDPLGMAEDTAKGVGAGALGYGLGKVAEPVVARGMNFLKKGASSLSESLEDVSGYASSKALGFQKGLRKKFGVDRVNEMGKTMLEDIPGMGGPVVTPMADTADMTARATALKEVSGKRIGDVMTGLDTAAIHQPDPSRMVAELKPAIDKIKGYSGASQAMGQYKKGVKDIGRYARKPTYKKLQDLKKIYGDLAFPGGKKNAEGVEGFKDVYYSIKRELERSTDEGVEKLAGGVSTTQMPFETFGERTGDLNALEQIPSIYRASKKHYGAAKIALEGLKDKAAAEAGNKFFGLTDTIMGSGGLTAALMTTNPMTAVATAGVIGAKKLGERQGPQTVATLSKKISERLARDPGRFGRYGDVINKSIKRGGGAFAATHMSLQQRDPEYRKMVADLDKEEDPSNTQK